MKSVLFYNLFPKTIWKEITLQILNNAPHDSIVIHVTMPWYAWLRYFKISKFLKQFNKVTTVYYSCNKKARGESLGFNKFRKKFDFTNYSIVSYTHSKGTSKKKKNTLPVSDWTELMRYFVIERLDLCKQAFENGYSLYGVNINNNVSHAKKYKNLETEFIYEGNFVSLNLNNLRHKFITAPCYKNYYGVERFWGNICDYEKAFCVHESNVDHYNERYPSSEYVQ